MSIKLGDYNSLRIVKEVDFGIYLDGGEEGEILMPLRYVPEDIEIGEEIECFIYLDSEERLVATTEHPYIKVGEFAALEVSWINEYGAFLNWGLMKDLFVPFREQKKNMEEGKRYVVYCMLDEESYRLMATAKVEKHLSKDMPTYEPNEEVDIMIWQRTELGFKAIVDNKFSGLIYENEVFQDLRQGEKLKGYIKQVREDGKIDLSLQKLGRGSVEDFSAELYGYLKETKGYCELNDKSPADDIYATFGVSKKVFKKAVGDLYKKRLITISSDGIHLVE